MRNRLDSINSLELSEAMLNLLSFSRFEVNFFKYNVVGDPYDFSQGSYLSELEKDSLGNNHIKFVGREESFSSCIYRIRISSHNLRLGRTRFVAKEWSYEFCSKNNISLESKDVDLTFLSIRERKRLFKAYQSSMDSVVRLLTKFCSLSVTDEYGFSGHVFVIRNIKPKNYKSKYSTLKELDHSNLSTKHMISELETQWRELSRSILELESIINKKEYKYKHLK